MSGDALAKVIPIFGLRSAGAKSRGPKSAEYACDDCGTSLADQNDDCAQCGEVDENEED